MKLGVSLSGMCQQPVGTDMIQNFKNIVTYAKKAQELGFDLVYQGQHYLTHPYQQLQTIPLLSRLSAEIEGMGIVGTLVIPLHQPVDLAERVATIDVLTGGKFHLGCALGYRDQEYESFGIDPKKRVARFLECLDIAQKLWTQGKVTYDGKFFQLNDVEAMLKPIQKPHPPIWIAANHDNAIKRAARRGYSWYVNPHAGYETIKRQIELYHETAENADSGAPKKLPIMREVFVHDDRKTAFAEANKFLGGKYEAYSQWGQDKALPEDDEFSDEFVELAKDRFVIGNPEDCVQDLLKYKELGMEYGIFRMMYPGMSLNSGMQLLETFASKVMPHIK